MAAATAAMPAFMTAAQKARLARIMAGRDLFRGRWRKFLLTDHRTAHVFKALRSASGREAPLLVTVNVLALAAKKTADLMFLDPPGISSAQSYDVQQDAIDEINQNSHSETVFYEGALTGCYEGESWVQIMRHNGNVILANVPADQCFGVGDPQPDGSYKTVEKIWILERGNGNGKRMFLRKEIHAANIITNQLYELNSRGALERQVDLSALYGPAAPGNEIETGVDEPLLAYCPNFRVGGECISDFDGVDELVDQFTASVSQVAGVIAKHADPKLGLPAEHADAASEDGGSITKEDEVFFKTDAGEGPEYLVWNAQLDAALKMVDNWLEWLLVVIEMSPGLLGLRKGGAPEAWRKLRLEACNTLSKVSRKKLWWNRFIIDRYNVAHKLDNTTPGTRYDFDRVKVDWNDGLPLDDQEKDERIIERRNAGLVDRQTAVVDIHGPENAEQINERLDKEEAAQRNMTMNLTEREI